MKEKTSTKERKTSEGSSMGNIKETIAKIILSRKKKLPGVQAKIKQLESLDSEVFSLEKILDEFVTTVPKFLLLQKLHGRADK